MTATVLNAYGTPVSGDALALDPMLTVQRERAADWAEARLWDRTSFVPTVGNRRMAAVGFTADPDSTAPGVMFSTTDGEDQYRI